MRGISYLDALSRQATPPEDAGGLVVLLATWFHDEAQVANFIIALTGLITAITGLIKALQAHSAAQAVQKQVNGAPPNKQVDPQP